MRLMPLLKFTNPANGTCFTLVDNCWTLGMIRRTEFPKPTNRWEAANDIDCPECCPACLSQESYLVPSEGGAFWGSNGNPAADEFFGLLATSIVLEPATSARRRGDSTLNPAEYTPRRLEIRGQFVAGSERGTAFGWQVFSDLLSRTGCGSDADGWQVDTRIFCPSDYDPGTWPPLETWSPDPLPALVDCAETDPCCGPCLRQDPLFVPSRLGPAIGTVGVVDTGERQVLDVRLVYFDHADDASTPACDGDDVILVFEVMSDGWFGNRVPGCDIGGFADDPDYCRPYNWEWACRTLPSGSDGCTVDPYTVTPVGIEPVRVASTDSGGSYCFPLWRKVKSCLAPAIPTSGDVALDIVVSAGTEDVRNLMIEVWPAMEGLPEPSSCEGELLYRAMRPVASAEIAWLPALSKLHIDGANTTITRSCAGRPFTSAEGAVTSWSDGRWDHPKLSPCNRYWITVTADCMNVNAGTTVALDFIPRFGA